jgi:hypothetical protein
MYKKYEYITLICEIFYVFFSEVEENGTSGYSVPSIAFFYFSVAYVLKSFDNLFVM